MIAQYSLITNRRSDLYVEKLFSTLEDTHKIDVIYNIFFRKEKVYTLK